MTTATTEGRDLVLTLEGLDPFKVQPLGAKRGRRLTEMFVEAITARMNVQGAEAIFIESIGPKNYVRIAGQYVDEFDASGVYVQTWNEDGPTVREGLAGTAAPAEYADGSGHVRFAAREALDGEPELDGEAIRQEEAESLTLCAFYWQTVVGMEAVRAFLEEGEGSRGSLKALALLQSRMGLSRPLTSQSSASESQMQQGATASTDTRSGGATSVRLPADRRSPLGMRLPSKGRSKR